MYTYIHTRVFYACIYITYIHIDRYIHPWGFVGLPASFCSVLKVRMAQFSGAAFGALVSEGVRAEGYAGAWVWQSRERRHHRGVSKFPGFRKGIQ